MSSTRIRLYPVEADYGFLGLSTAPASEAEGLAPWWVQGVGFGRAGG